MKRFTTILASAAAALVCSLALARNDTPPTSPPVDEQQAQAERNMEEQMMKHPTRPTSTFDQLDVDHHGYLTAADRKKDPWLAKHFQRCDTDGDGRLTRMEFDACTKTE
ncbi:hypothetical protein [Dokdonella sp.]|uniref:hypothetical protein n=1 Tax=Dokdonella sp. TaxID=2291710 RepID=UPI001B0F97BB|nr:hypothetical protein [Dokdonella sp.]MBO9662895.1 hypothetical protein [Dokdonella sp.]